jgi:hypothetical protein
MSRSAARLRGFSWRLLLPEARTIAVPLIGAGNLKRAADGETGRPSAVEIARQVCKLLTEDPTLMVRAGNVGSVPAHTVDQRTACKIIKASDSTLRRGRYFNDMATTGHDPTKLNGVLVGREWRFDVREVQRFADHYWGLKKQVTEGARVSIRGRDL